ncbi:MAG: methylenetetrahydrofolate--tRNA-(uracil(54)-C(5))-methyltransferase (FADH(2)-oxidizing) TrmFO [Eubacteriales bacterium]|jgi:methylenetetrahydrofolate--tRNA-(uracil-5-)-methyltransferase
MKTQQTGATVIGAGLAGCEAAWQLAQAGIPVTLYEMKPQRMTPAHKSPQFCELVCSNSLRGDQLENAVGLLKEELRHLGSVVMQAAEENRLPAGGALAVDREGFSRTVTDRIRSHSLITVVEQHVEQIPEGPVIVATGPLSTPEISQSIGELLGEESLYFYDAAAPIVAFESIDMDKAYFASRYDRGTPDYINCPMDQEQYEAFYQALITAEEAPTHSFEKVKVFEGCMPVEIMAKRGENTLLFGPLKPVGLPDPRTGKEPYAVVQLRKDNREGTMYNIVGFQTHLKFPEQKRVFSMIPGLENAVFLRYGVMHRNTFIQSPKLLNCHFQMRSHPDIYFAGQMTGVEGYVESTASGLLAGLNLARRLQGKPQVDFTNLTAIGALASYISDESVTDFQPMNVNFGIMAPYKGRFRKKREKNFEIAMRALDTLDMMIEML